MSTDTSSDPTDLTEPKLREQFDDVVQGRNVRSKVLHLPDPDADDPEPLCDRYTSSGWRLVSVAAFPPSYRDFCSYCRDKHQEQEQGPACPRCGDRFDDFHAIATHVGRAHPEERPRDVVDTVRYGDAMAAEWGEAV